MSEDLKAAHRELTGKVMGRKGVVGTAIGEEGGRPCLKVYLSAPDGARGVPSRVRGYRVVIERTGGFKRL